MGHDHKKPITFLDKLRLKGQGNSLRLRERKILLARTGAFLRGYVDGQKSYIVDAGMKPTSIGVVKIELTPRREHGPGNEEEVYIDIHAGI